MPLRKFADSFPTLVKRLGQARVHDRVAHAYLFNGDSMPLLEAFSAAWIEVCLCAQPTREGDACGTCDSCHKLQADSYPYLNRLQPQSKSRHIVIDQIRELEHYLHLTSGGYRKVGWLLGADRMNDNAQNAFLKTLEEPSATTLLILVTTNPGDLLPTIRSRCQTVPLLQNQVAYQFQDATTFFAQLARLRRGQGAAVATAVAGYMTETLKSVRKSAEAEAKKAQKHLAKNTEDLDAGVRKRLQTEFEAQAAALYLDHREQLLSALHCWFAQEYLRANDVAVPSLPNPELYAETTPAAPVAADACHSLRLTEKLLTDLSFNVDEQLAIHDFCLQLCAKDPGKRRAS